MSRIPQGWSAEGIALSNLKNGIFPPKSGSTSNPYREWIGAQMRGSICGLVAPNDPYTAFKLAMIDASISHTGNGALGEAFNALLTSISFKYINQTTSKKSSNNSSNNSSEKHLEPICRTILKEVIEYIPKDSEYRSVLDFAINSCIEEGEWENAWKKCDKKYEEYNWIHCYPNAAAEVIALYFCNDSFNECMHIISMEGLDADCNAAQIGTILGILVGEENIDLKWKLPIGDNLNTYMRGFEKFSIKELSKRTFEAFYKANFKDDDNH